MAKEVKVTKEVTFDCAHMLSGHEALCKNLHGHTYKVQISVIGPTLEEGSSAGMVMDFKHLKQAIKEVIMDNFDHAVIFSSEEFRGEAEEELYAWAKKHGLRHYVMSTRTTAENMAIYFYSQFKEYFKIQGISNARSIDVKVFETPTSCAEV